MLFQALILSNTYTCFAHDILWHLYETHLCLFCWLTKNIDGYFERSLWIKPDKFLLCRCFIYTQMSMLTTKTVVLFSLFLTRQTFWLHTDHVATNSIRALYIYLILTDVHLQRKKEKKTLKIICSAIYKAFSNMNVAHAVDTDTAIDFIIAWNVLEVKTRFTRENPYFNWNL